MGRLHLYCGEKGHFFAECPTIWEKDSVTHYSPIPHSQFCVDVLNVTNPPVSLSVLVDSGSAGNYVSSTLFNNVSIPVEKIANLVSVRALDGQLITNLPVMHITRLLQISFPQPAHSETIKFYVSPHARLPWLRKHYPIVVRQAAQILSWSPRCAITCHHPVISLHSTLIESPNAHIHVQIPREYR